MLLIYQRLEFNTCLTHAPFLNDRLCLLNHPAGPILTFPDFLTMAAHGSVCFSDFAITYFLLFDLVFTLLFGRVVEERALPAIRRCRLYELG